MSAEAFGVDADFHADFADEPEHLHVRAIIDETLRAGRQGRVVVGHLTEVAALPSYAQDEIAITTHPAAMLRLPDYGLAPGCAADLGVWECEQPEEIVATLPGRTLVVKRGRVTVQFERRVVERWREP